MAKRLIALFLFSSLFILNQLQGQYFQQKVSYAIDATQDTLNRSLEVTCDITYTNNSPNTIDTFFIHLWANAFSDKLSAYSEQTIGNGSLDFYFSKEEEMGGYSNLQIFINGNKMPIHSWMNNPDVIYLLLPKSLESGDELAMNTSYELKLPKLFSRMGYNKFDDYLMYWYPTPAVYDSTGWHPMPYLEMGEFYSEFAAYSIQLKTPITNLISSSPPQKNELGDGYLFKAGGMIDFAIVTSKNKPKYEREIVSKKGNKIQFHMLTSRKERFEAGIKYLEPAINYLEPLIGNFPYAHLSILDKGATSTSGMEYPGLITVSGADEGSGDFEYYLVHELLHQWFYSALAFNQRKFSWLDEGLTTYYQQRYYQEVLGIDHYSDKAAIVMHSGQQPFLQTMAIGQAQRHLNKKIQTSIAQLDPINYGLNAYEIPARMFAYLADYLGKERFDHGMQEFYKLWQNKHPDPQDLQSVLESVSDKDLNWFFTDLIQNDWSYDYSLHETEKDGLIVKHISGSTPPYKITYLSEDKITSEQWYEGHSENKSITTPVESWKSASIDHAGLSMDINPNNNHAFTKRPIKLVPGIKLDDGRYREIYMLPTISYNSSDRAQLGLALFNSTFPSKKLKWALSPAYGFGSKKILGEAWLSYDHYLDESKFRKLQYKLNAKTYDFQTSESLDQSLRYVRISPKVSLYFNHDPVSKINSNVYAQSVFLDEEYYIFQEEDIFIGNRRSGLVRFGYEYYNFWKLGPSEFHAQLEYQPYTNIVDEKHHYAKLSAAYQKSFFYTPKRSIEFRFWASYFISNSQRASASYDGDITKGSAALIYQGFNDYAYDDYFFNRANQNVGLDNQIGYNGGGFKTPLGSQYSLGQSNDFIFSLNLKSNLPIKTPTFLPLKVFMDIGYFTSKATSEDPVKGSSMYSGGIMLEYANGLFSVYLPLINSSSISDLYNIEGIGTLGRISFRVDLVRFNPWEIAEEYSF